MLVLKEVTHEDQGLYAIKLSSGFTYEAVRLTVSGGIVSTLFVKSIPVLFHQESPASLIM